MGLACLVRLCLRRRLRNILLHKIEIQQPVGVVEGGAEDLPPGNILESCRDAAGAQHRAGINRPRAAEAGQGRPEGADQESRLDHVAAGLFNRQRCKFRVEERSFRHDPGGGQLQLLRNLVQCQIGDRLIAAPDLGKPPVGIVDGFLSAFDSHIHGFSPPSRRVLCFLAPPPAAPRR